MTGRRFLGHGPAKPLLIPVSRVLPPPIRDALVAAAGIRNPHERIRAIDRAADHGRLTHPKFFR